ncbi:hypothetical protein [Arthrobacter sp. C9C5]|uniref:hypothetical protein n=1 Tax=Arthrobacter sp. C9C5 TaxID=2735267 RepID=UPI001584899F|nr:hypothetical protein [Arthrobacter sp. C9C5]NUU31822.1 hypothetical protein [Arthrobacter sp. C9C5]
MALTPRYRVRNHSMRYPVIVAVGAVLLAGGCIRMRFFLRKQRTAMSSPQVTVNDVASMKLTDATSPMNDGGGFTYTFEVPSNMAVGDAAVTAVPFNITR